MTRPLRAFSLRISSTVPRLELDTGRPARYVRYLEYRNDEQYFLLSVGQSIITGPVLRRYGAEIRTDARLVGQPSHQGNRSNWAPHHDRA